MTILHIIQASPTIPCANSKFGWVTLPIFLIHSSVDCRGATIFDEWQRFQPRKTDWLGSRSHTVGFLPLRRVFHWLKQGWWTIPSLDRGVCIHLLKFGKLTNILFVWRILSVPSTNGWASLREDTSTPVSPLRTTLATTGADTGCTLRHKRGIRFV